MTVTFEKVYYVYPTFATWSAVGTVIKPLKPVRTLSDNTQAGFTVTVKLATDTAALKPGQVVRLNFSGSYDYLVIVDGGKSSSHGENAYYTHTYTVQELLAITREMHVQTAFFTGADYTPTQFFTRLFALTDKDYAIQITSATLAALLTNWKYADYQVASNSLLDNLVKIGKNNGVRFKMSFDATSATPLQLSCISLNGTSTIASIAGTLIADTSHYKGSNFAARVSSIVENMASDQTKWWPSMSFTDGARGEPSDIYATETTEDDICLVLPHNIRDCTKVRVVGFTSALITDSATPDGDAGGSNYKYFDMEGTEIEADPPDPSTHYVVYDDTVANQTTRSTSGYVDEFDVVDEPTWLALDATGTGSQEDTLYFKRGENKIYNLKICQGFGTAGKVYELKKYDGSWNYTSSVFQYQYMRNHRNYYTALCNLYEDGEIMSSNELANDETEYHRMKKRTAFYSQEENQAAGKALADNMQGYIDSMRNAEYEAAYKFDAMTDIPALGSIFNDMVLYEIELDINVSYIAANLRFSDDLVPKSEYLTADNGTQLGKIPLDKAYDRITNYRTCMWFCASAERAYEVQAAHLGDAYFDAANYADNLMKAFDNGTTLPPLAFDEALLKMTTVYTALQVHSCALNDKLIVNFRTIDNRIVGRLIDETTPTNAATLRFYPVNFIPDDGVSDTMAFKLVNPTVRASEANYPAITSATYNAASDIVTVSDSSYYHDRAERMNVTYQLDAKVYNYGRTGKVHQAFWEESCFFRDTFFTADAYTRYLHLDATNTDYEIDHTTVTASSGIYEVKVFLSEEATASTVAGVAFTIFRKLKASPYTEEDMVTAVGTITSGSPDYVTFYLAFTK